MIVVTMMISRASEDASKMLAKMLSLHHPHPPKQTQKPVLLLHMDMCASLLIIVLSPTTPELKCDEQ